MYYYLRLLRKIRYTDAWPLMKLMGLLSILVVLFVFIFTKYEENVTIWDSAWTAYVSLTTIGYGDFAAKSWQGRVATVCITFLGIGSLTMLAGTIIDRTFERRMKRMRGEGEYKGEGHIVIINIPSYDEVLRLLAEMDACAEYLDIPRVLVASQLPGADQELPQNLMKKVDCFVKGTPSSMETLNRANVSKATGCILLSHGTDPTVDDVNTMTAGIIEKNWPDVVTIVNCTRGDTLKNLKHFGIDGGVNSTGLQMGLLVQELKHPGTFEVYDQLSSNSWGQQIYISDPSPNLTTEKGKKVSFGDLMRGLIGLNIPVNLVGVRNAERRVELNIKYDYNIQEGDHLIYLAGERFDWSSQLEKIVRFSENQT